MAAQHKILLLDDDQDFLDLYKEMLANHLSCLPEVRTASSGSRALSLLESESFTLMIVDLNMPYMSGHELVAALLADATLPSFPFVFLSGDGKRMDHAALLGASACLLKPVGKVQLLAAVAKALDPAAELAAA